MLTDIRDIAIILLAVESIVIGLLLIILILQIRSLAEFVQKELKPILDSAKETVSTVQGTTTFVSDSFVTPLIRASSFASGVSRVLKTLLRL
jgi:hypothetical protein